MKHQLLIVDGYNMIGAWPELVTLKKQDRLEEARDQLLHELSNYAKYNGIEIIVVFDAQLVKGATQVYDQYTLQVVFTAKDETADTYIEALAYQRLDLLTQVSVATSDLAEQWQVFSAGALRKSARELYKDIHKTKKSIQRDSEEYQFQNYRRNSPWNDDQLTTLSHLLGDLQNESSFDRQ